MLPATIGLYVKCLIFALCQLNLDFLIMFLQMCPGSNITEMHPMGATLIYADRYGRMGMTKLIGAFHDGEHLKIST